MVCSDYEEGRSPKAAPRKIARQSIPEGSSSRRPYSEDEVRLHRRICPLIPLEYKKLLCLQPMMMQDVEVVEPYFSRDGPPEGFSICHCQLCRHCLRVY